MHFLSLFYCLDGSSPDCTERKLHLGTFLTGHVGSQASTQEATGQRPITVSTISFNIFFSKLFCLCCVFNNINQTITI